jgi:hypothetical protein
MHYFLVLLPSIILGASGVLLSIFSLEQTSKAMRLTIAGALVLMAIISGYVSAGQAQSQDAQIAALSTGIDNVNSNVDSVKAQMPRVPRLEVREGVGDLASNSDDALIDSISRSGRQVGLIS